jgi:hypothetical protein
MAELTTLRAVLDGSIGVTPELVNVAIEGGLLDYVSPDPEPILELREIANWFARGCPTDDLDDVA